MDEPARISHFPRLDDYIRGQGLGRTASVAAATPAKASLLFFYAREVAGFAARTRTRSSPTVRTKVEFSGLALK